MTYDVAKVRALYPALADGWAYLDGAAGTQVPRSVIDAESAAYAAGIGNHGGVLRGVQAVGRRVPGRPRGRSSTSSGRRPSTGSRSGRA